MPERLFAVAVWGASLAPLVRWWWKRLAEPFDAGGMAAAALVVFIACAWGRERGGRTRPATWKILVAAVGLFLFHGLRPFLPLTLCGVFGLVGGLPLLLPETENRLAAALPLPLVGLAVAMLPSLMILDLFLGVPLRLLATVATAALLRGTGLNVVRDGLALVVDGSPVWVDAPCAGVQMLGTGIVLALVLAQVFRFGWGRTCIMGLVGLAAVVAANCARVATLTFYTAVVAPLSPAAHEFAGCCALLPALVVCAASAIFLRKRP